MEKGTLETLQRLTCPHCEHKEFADHIGQYEGFQDVNTPGQDIDGQTQNWVCRCCLNAFCVTVG